MNRDNKGRFTSIKNTAENIGIALVVLAVLFGIIMMIVATAKLQAVEAQTGTSTPVQVYPQTKRVDQVQQLIDTLTVQVEHDSTFQAETAKEEAQLQAARHQAAIEGALFIIKTQYDSQVYKVINTK